MCLCFNITQVDCPFCALPETNHFPKVIQSFCCVLLKNESKLSGPGCNVGLVPEHKCQATTTTDQQQRHAIGVWAYLELETPLWREDKLNWTYWLRKLCNCSVQAVYNLNLWEADSEWWPQASVAYNLGFVLFLPWPQVTFQLYLVATVFRDGR